jgi:hypothetical protein
MRPATSSNTSFEDVKVKGSDIKFVRVITDKTAVPGTNGIKVFEGEFTTINDVVINEFVITNKSNLQVADVTGSIYEPARIVINGETFELTG